MVSFSLCRFLYWRFWRKLPTLLSISFHSILDDSELLPPKKPQQFYAMATADPKTGTTYATTDWGKYQQSRPSYPASLTETIYNYRRRHPQAGWERLVDIGAGSGVAAINFMHEFKIVHISDPSPWNEEQAREFLSDWTKRHGVSPKLEYSQSTGEEAHKHAGEGQADMVICGTAAHFMDPDGLVEASAKILRPGGTLAVYSYWNPSFPGRSQQFHDAFGKTFDKLVLKVLEAGDDANRRRLAKVIERRLTGGGCLDSVPLPEKYFDDPLRVYINAGPGEIPYKDLYHRFAPANGEVGGTSRVSARDKIVRYTTGVDAAAEGWAFDADKKWFPIFFNTIRPAHSKLSEEEAREAFAEWDQIFDAECPDGNVRVQWPCYLVLATRK
jgi:SAM-dependent methyltransferase